MKKFIVLSALVASLVSGVAFAHGGKGEGRDGNRMDRLKEKLSLTDAQVQQIETLRTEQRDQMKAIMDEGQNAIVQLLTTEQAVKFQELKQKRQERMAKHEGKGGWGKGKGHGGYRHGSKDGKKAPDASELAAREDKMAEHMSQRLQKSLSLTDAQVSQVKAIFKTQAEKMQQLRSKNKEQGFSSILTAEQITKFEELKKQRMEHGGRGRNHHRGVDKPQGQAM